MATRYRTLVTRVFRRNKAKADNLADLQALTPEQQRKKDLWEQPRLPLGM